jgi:hypothetical protein
MRTIALCTLVAALAACQENTIPPEQAATDFARDLGLAVTGKPVCAGVDTDRDGYVTCTLNLGDGRLESIQCAALGASELGSHFAIGCKGTVAKAAPPTVVR